jgi:hypothetical protein
MDDDRLSISEFNKRKQLIELCIDIVNEYEYILSDDFVEEEF